MQIYIPERLVLEIGRLPWSNRLGVHLGVGWIKGAAENEIPWRHHWTWQPHLPNLIWEIDSNYRRRLIGFCAFGRCRVWR